MTSTDDNMSANTASTTTTSPTTPGVAGRINYAQWDRVATDLVEQSELDEQEEIAAAKAALGHDKGYARSQAEADEKVKAQQVLKTKEALDKYKKRETQLMQTLPGLLGPAVIDKEQEEAAQDKTTTTTTHPTTVRITRDRLEAGKRVLVISDTSGTSSSSKDTIVLTQDLSHLESKMAVNAHAKTYQDDAENDVPTKQEQQPDQQQQRSIFGLIKCFLHNLHNCTILVKCKIISGTMELHNCSNIVVKIEKEATVATIQADLSENVTIEFRDAPSGKNTATGIPMPNNKKMYWGDDCDDRIFHAGVKNMTVRIVRDDMVESEITCDYLKDGATAVGNASAEEMQFITSVVNGQLVTEKVVRSGSTTGKNVRAMTERELQEEKERREKAAALAVQMAEDMIQIKDKDGNVLASKKETKAVAAKEKEGDGEIEEVYSSVTQAEIQDIVDECEQNKARGNEAFQSGEYGQAILLYSLALDKAEELPDKDSDKKLFPRDVLYSNRAACFLKLGQHEKAEEDASRALEINPNNIKATFRRGLALHAMGQYQQALPVLAEAHKLEPKNKQINQALQFCEARLAQEQRKRMES